jgi:Tol biopolymer transport system component
MAGCDVYAVDVDATLSVVGSPRRLTTQVVNRIIHVTWTRDSRSLVYDQREGESRYLWRVNAVEGGEPERIEAAGQEAIQPACAASQDRLAFTRVRTDLDIYSVSAGQAPRPLLTSSYADFHPKFSPDGQQIAFSSARAAEVPEVWLAASDGTQMRQLTHAPGRYQSEPNWSPDGQTIAFESLGKDGHWHIWTIDAVGGVPRQLTGPKEDQFVPTWSHDGRWVYFTDDDGTGKRAVSRIPAMGGQPQRVTEGGDVPIGYETADGKSVLYKLSYVPGPLLSVPLTGGPARVVVPCVLGGRSFVSRKEGIYYIACEPKDEPPIRLFDPSSGRDHVLATPEDAERGDGDFSVSPDGRTILYTRQMELNADLMMIENFH